MSRDFYTEEQTNKMVETVEQVFRSFANIQECILIEDFKSKHALSEINASIQEILKEGKRPLVFIHAKDYDSFCFLNRFNHSSTFKNTLLQRMLDAGYIGVLEGVASVYSNRFVRDPIKLGYRVPTESCVFIVDKVEDEKVSQKASAKAPLSEKSVSNEEVHSTKDSSMLESNGS